MSENDFHSPPALPPVANIYAESQPSAQPIPVQSLPYSHAVQHSRPGSLTAIGVISIIVACFSCMGSLMSGCQAGSYYFISRMSRSFTKSPTYPTSKALLVPTNVMPPATTMTTTDTGDTTEPASPVVTAERPTGLNGLGSADRHTVISVLSNLQPMKSEQRDQLDAFLAEQGTSMFPTADVPLTESGVRLAVSRSATQTGTGDTGIAVFVNSWGTLKIQNDNCDFAPADGSTHINMVATPLPDNNSTASVTPAFAASPGTALTPAEIQGAVQRAQQATGNKLNKAQLNAISIALADPNQTLITPGTAWSPVQRAIVNPDGSATLIFTGSYFQVDAQGQMTSTAPTMPTFNVNSMACALVGVEAMLSIGLAIFLFIAALAVLRQSPSGRQLHRIYACIKIPLAVAGGAAMWWMNSELSITGSSGGTSIMIGWGMAGAVVAVIYPIALLIAFSTKNMREYYNAVRG